MEVENAVNVTENEQSENNDTSNKKRKTPWKKDKRDKAKKLKDCFTVLAPVKPSKNQKVKPVAAEWLAKPTTIPLDLTETTKVSSLKGLLDDSIIKLLKANGLKHLFPVQSTVVPWLLKTNKHKDFVTPRDVCVCAPTGSGKTLAFVLPVVQALKHYHIRKVRALVIVPTQDLAAQVYKTFKTYTEGLNIETCLITGMNSFEAEQKQLIYKNDCFGYVSRVDVLICTAGRLVKHLTSTPGFDLKQLQFLIIDEADRVLDNIQDDWLYHLEKHVHQGLIGGPGVLFNLQTLSSRIAPRKLLFSATLTQDPEKLQKLSLFQPQLFTSAVEKSTDENTEDVEENDLITESFARPKELIEKYLLCSKEMKPLVLYALIKREKLKRTIIFTHSIESAHRLAILLRGLFKNKRTIEEISSVIRGSSRDDLIGKFTRGEIDILICTDFLARGIDLPNVECVISYTSPKHLKTYIHRAGRTARAGLSGQVITILDEQQLQPFKSLHSKGQDFNMEQIDISVDDLQSSESRYKKALSSLKTTISTEDEKIRVKQKTLKKNWTRRKSINK